MDFREISEINNKVISNAIFLGKNFLKQSHQVDEDNGIIKSL